MLLFCDPLFLLYQVRPQINYFVSGDGLLFAVLEQNVSFRIVNIEENVHWIFVWRGNAVGITKIVDGGMTSTAGTGNRSKPDVN